MSDASAGRAANATRDAFLGGLVQLLQPARGTGHRAGLDAVYLAAAVDPSTTGHVLDLGSGSGAAGFCLVFFSLPADSQSLSANFLASACPLF